MPRFPERASALERRVDPDAAGEAHSSGRARAEVGGVAQPDPISAGSTHTPAEQHVGGLIDVSSPAAAVAPHAHADASLDLLGELVQAAAPAPDPLAGLEDFSSGLGGGGPATSTPHAPVQPTQDTQLLFRKLCASDSGAWLRARALLPRRARP